jgi:hypothetical protein
MVPLAPLPDRPFAPFPDMAANCQRSVKVLGGCATAGRAFFACFPGNCLPRDFGKSFPLYLDLIYTLRAQGFSLGSQRNSSDNRLWPPGFLSSSLHLIEDGRLAYIAQYSRAGRRRQIARNPEIVVLCKIVTLVPET